MNYNQHKTEKSCYKDGNVSWNLKVTCSCLVGGGVCSIKKKK